MLSEAELLAIIIKTGTKGETSIQLAQRLLAISDNNQKQGLEYLKELTLEELKRIKGIGKVKAIQLKAMCELAIRMAKPADYRKIKIKSPYDLAKILLLEMQNEKREVVKIVILNSRNEIIKIKDIALGGSNFVNLNIKDILSDPIKMQAPKIILVHNHPSGNSNPSKADIEFTKKVYKASEIFEIELLDHLVIGNMQYTSIFSELTKDI